MFFYVMISLDGDYLEGGGSIVRVALALSTITQKPFEITSIRKGRPDPGLKNQHLFCIKALEQLCNAKSEGAHLGSTSLKYVPGKIEGKTISVDIQTAGSIPLFLQAVILPSIFADKKLKLDITGGTDGKWAAPIDYFNEIFLPQIRKYADIEIKLIKRGYYPKGNGKVEIKINPKYKISDFNNFEEFHKNLKENAPKFNLTEQGHLMQIKGISHASSNLKEAKVSERQASSAELLLKRRYSIPININSEYQNTLSTGSGITLWAIFSKNRNDINENNPIRLGADALGEQGKKAEVVGNEAASNLVMEIESGAAVDSHLADQLIPFMGLLPGSGMLVPEVSKHTLTNIYVVEKFLPVKFMVEGNKISVADR